MTGKPKGHVREVLGNMQTHGLVRKYIAVANTRRHSKAITYLWQITDLGQKVSDAGPAAYLRTVRSRRGRRNGPMG